MYSLIMRLRNWCFDHGWLKQQDVGMPVICVGNLAMGGTGKTPMVELFVDELRRRGHKPAVVSRGYGRKTRGALLVTPESTAEEVGDEPLQICRRKNCPVVVAEKRIEALPVVRKWNRENPESAITIIVLDDAYQHRYIKRDYNILLTDYSRLYTRDKVIPWGRLREPISGAKRADAIVVTKCPETLSRSEADTIRRELQALPHQRVSFATIDYESLPPLAEPAVLITGIANPQPIIRHLRSQGIEIAQHLKFADHHRFSSNELQEFARISAPIITTAKDAARLPANLSLNILNIRTKILYTYAENS